MASPLYCCSGPFTFDSSMAHCKRFQFKRTCPATWLVSNLFPRGIFYSVALSSTHTVPGGLQILTTLQTPTEERLFKKIQPHDL